MEMLLEEKLLHELMIAGQPMHGPRFHGMGPGAGPGRGPGMQTGPGPEGMHPGPEHGRMGPGPGGSRPGRPDMPKPMLSRERVLEVLLGEEKGMHQKDVAMRLHIGPPALSEFVGHLESHGYIVREIDPDDRRATRLKLTPKGEARAWEVREERRERMARRFGSLTDEEKEELLRLLQKMNESGQMLSGPSVPV